MKQIKLTILFAVLLNVGCNTSKKEITIETDESLAFPVLVDTSWVKESLEYDRVKNPTWLTFSDYKFCFIGETKDTIYLTTSIDIYTHMPPQIRDSKKTSVDDTVATNSETPYKKYCINSGEKRSYKEWTQSNIEVIVGTKNIFYNFYPIILTNRGLDTTLIGNDRHIPLIMEAKDSLGKWKPIQKQFVASCGTGVGLFILPPKECVLTFAPIFEGNYKTQLRLTIGNNHSKPFDGFINLSQFESKYNVQ